MEINRQIIRFIAVLFFIAAFSVSATAQQIRTAVKIEKAPLEQVFDKIEANSDYVFLYKESEVDKSRIVSVTTSSTKITDILDEIFRGTDVVYSIMDKQIVLSIKKQQPKQTPSDKVRVNGVVYDDNGYPMIGAGVMIKGTTIGTITDIDGVFSLEVP
ncbi:MAG: secretin and TonB N-terminal domain-containing protein, partial [Candidatus Cryptobacteroides sp.]